jgi:hypothetical protein
VLNGMAGEIRDGTARDRTAALWNAADRIVDRASLAGILAHKLGPLAANRLRRLGRPLPESLREEERSASISMLTAGPLVARVREGWDRPLILVKGPEVARLYPGSARRFGDIDVITADAEDLQRSLMARGFVDALEPGELTPDEHHHLLPLKSLAIPLRVEVHIRPHWPAGTTPPRLDEILEACVPSDLGIDGVVTPAPHHHALILTSHAWGHAPLDTLRDLIDIAAVAARADERDVERAAAAWGIDRIWLTTRGAIDALFYEGQLTVPLRSWARHVALVRSQSVLENHLRRWVASFWEMPPHTAIARLPLVLRDELAPTPDETGRDKLARIARALRRPRSAPPAQQAPPSRRQERSE